MLHFSCDDCVLLENTLNYIKSRIDNNVHLPELQRSLYQITFKRQYGLIEGWERHQLRTVHQETAKDSILEQLDHTSVSKVSLDVFYSTPLTERDFSTYA